MKNLKAFTTTATNKAVALFSIIMLVFISFNGMSQNNNNPGQNPDRSSHAEQSSEYLHNIETDPNGVPNTTAWYAQPWIWAIVAAVLILFIGMLARNSGKKEVESGSENGLR